MDAVTHPPAPTNEPVHTYAPGSDERSSLTAAVKELAGETAELTMTIGGAHRMAGGDTIQVVAPHKHRLLLGRSAQATPRDVEAAVGAALAAAPGWRELPFDERAAVFLRAADLLSTTWRDRLNAATMLGQSKTVHQAEIDAACELADFLRWNVHFARQILRRTADEQCADMEPHGLPAAGRLRAGDHPVQLHRDRRQPAVGAGLARQRRGVEALADPAAGCALHDARCSRRPACRRA